MHVNAEFFDQASDHDPSVVRVRLNDAPTVSAGGPYAVDEGSSTVLTASGSDPEGGALTYAWDLDDNGSFETPGQSVSFSADDGPATPTVRVQVTDDIGQTATDQATVTVRNVPPTATFSAPASSNAGFPFTLSLTAPSDPSAADTAAGFGYAFDCGDGPATGRSARPRARAARRATPARARSARQDPGQGRRRDRVQRHRPGQRHVRQPLCASCAASLRRTEDADALCAKLADAAQAPNEMAPGAGKLNAFRNQVDAKTGSEPGKSFTSDQGALLKLLSTRL